MTYSIPEKNSKLIDAGEFLVAEKYMKEDLAKGLSFGLKKRIEFELERLARWKINYPYSIEHAYELLKNQVENLSKEDFLILISRGCIDHKIIENKIFIFDRFIPNLFWLCPDQKRRKKKTKEEREKTRRLLKERAFKVIASGEGFNSPIVYHVRMSIRIKTGSIPVGEKVRVWMPLPREDDINSDVKIVKAEPEILRISDREQRTVYFEDEMRERLEFSLEYKFTSRGFYRKIDENKVEPFDENSDVYKVFTEERPPHIVFTPYLIKLAEDITRDERNPYLKVKRIWSWITHNVRYTYAHDYALYDNISEYTARNRRGDCGMQALLFITLCRIVGIPARWQSGWYMNPIRPGMHDWAQFYIEPYGWLYADPSFGSIRHGEDWRNDFYLGNSEGFRLAANIEISVPFDPPKLFFRSDPVDNQRGEVEWERGNLYYNLWDYKFEIIRFC